MSQEQLQAIENVINGAIKKQQSEFNEKIGRRSDTKILRRRHACIHIRSKDSDFFLCDSDF